MKKYIAMALGLLLSSAAAAQEFPVTIQHSQGKVTLKQPPERVVALSLADYDTLVSLGVQPVNFVVHYPEIGIKFLPWNKPVSDSIPVIVPSKVSLEVIAALRPDFIDASTMYNVSKIYSQLSNIAPTLAKLDSNKWTTDSWQERTLSTGRLIGKEAKAKKVVNNTERTIQQFAKQHPELKGKTFTFSYVHSPKQGTIGTVINEIHPSVKLFKNFGLKLSPDIQRLFSSSQSQRAPLSAEAWHHLSADYIFVAYGSKEAQEAIESNPFFKKLINEKGVKYIPLSYAENVALQVLDPLNIPWVLNSLEAKL